MVNIDPEEDKSTLLTTEPHSNGSGWCIIMSAIFVITVTLIIVGLALAR